MEDLKEILFIDIETVPTKPEYNLMSDAMQAEWTRKAKFIKSTIEGNTDPATIFDERAGIFSEFAKIVCIGFGSLSQTETAWKMRLKSLINDDEKILLNEFCEVISRFTKHYKDIRFCGHNIKEFDIPFICRRMVINGITLPDCMQVAGKKPWEVTHIDTMDMWKFGDHKNFTSLSLLATVLGIPSPKTDIDGSMVADVYWKDKDLARIGKYCLQDVYTSAKVFLRLKGINGIDIEPVYVTD
ncbi:MAG: 3-5 exonuclease [Flavipsychrobacter sp.]|nr:3-5 exonuclease [Flavipsychrobacter sp.]